MKLQEILDQKRLELHRVEEDMLGISPKTFSYQRLRALHDTLSEQIHVLQAQRDGV